MQEAGKTRDRMLINLEESAGFRFISKPPGFHSQQLIPFIRSFIRLFVRFQLTSLRGSFREARISWQKQLKEKPTDRARSLSLSERDRFAIFWITPARNMFRYDRARIEVKVK